MIESTDAQLIALADLFPDKLDAAKPYFDSLLHKRGLPPSHPQRLYRGHQSAAQLATSDVDAVILAITPYFYPMVLEGVVQSGKHIYCEKPVATEVAGCLKVMDFGRKTEGKFVFM
jgi:predicted dehydrogenase